MRLLLRSLFAVGVFFLATGYTECEHFAEVTVPATDSTRPNTFAFVRDVATGTNEHFSEDHSYTGRVDEHRFIVIGGYDGSGVKTVEVEGERELWCAPNYEYGPVEGTPFSSVQSQNLPASRRVSNGVYETITVDYAAGEIRRACARHGFSGPAARYISFRAKVTDFHGNVSWTPRYEYSVTE